MRHDPDQVCAWLTSRGMTTHQARLPTTRTRAERDFPHLDDITWAAARSRLRTATAQAALGGGTCPDCSQHVRRLPGQHDLEVVVDPLPHPKGRVVLVTAAGRTTAALLGPHSRPAPGLPRHNLHSDTCPAAAHTRPTRCTVCGTWLHPWLAARRIPTHPACNPTNPPATLTHAEDPDHAPHPA